MIREFREKDAGTLANISQEAFSDEIVKGMSRLKPENFIEYSKRPGVKIFVAESSRGSVVGFLSLTEGSVEAPAQIHMVAVQKEKRGEGVGKALVKRALEHARAVGRKKVKLFTRPWNIPMRKVCVELGFIPEACLRKEFLDEDVILYSAFLE